MAMLVYYSLLEVISSNDLIVDSLSQANLTKLLGITNIFSGKK